MSKFNENGYVDYSDDELRNEFNSHLKEIKEAEIIISVFNDELDVMYSEISKRGAKLWIQQLKIIVKM